MRPPTTGAKLAAAHGAATTSGEAGLAARELAQAAGHQAQMAAQDADGEYAPCSLAPACECDDGCSSDEEDSEPLPAKLAQQMLERDAHTHACAHARTHARTHTTHAP